MKRFFSLAALSFLALVTVPVAAWADGITVVRGQFTDRIEGNHPVGDASSLQHGQRAVYWFQLNNTTHAAGQVTLIWSLNGNEVHRQQMTVLNQRVMRTWAFLPVRRANSIAVRIVDASGATLHENQATIGDGAAAPAPATTASAPPAAGSSAPPAAH